MQIVQALFLIDSTLMLADALPSFRLPPLMVALLCDPMPCRRRTLTFAVIRESSATSSIKSPFPLVLS